MEEKKKKMKGWSYIPKRLILSRRLNFIGLGIGFIIGFFFAVLFGILMRNALLGVMALFLFIGLGWMFGLEFPGSNLCLIEQFLIRRKYKKQPNQYIKTVRKGDSHENNYNE